MMNIAYAESVQVNPFVYRFPRFGLNLAIRLFTPDGQAIGRCVDVSESGLLGDFDHPLDLCATGEITAFIGAETVSIKAHVTRVSGNQAGLAFHADDDEGRFGVARLIRFALMRR